MSRQNLTQGGLNPWVAHGCLDGAMALRPMDAALRPRLPRRNALALHLNKLAGLAVAARARLCRDPIRASRAGAGRWRGLALLRLYVSDHPEASSDGDLARLDALDHVWMIKSPPPPHSPAVRSLVQDAPSAVAEPLDAAGLARTLPERLHEERLDDRLLSFFTQDPPHNRHVVLRDKELLRHAPGMAHCCAPANPCCRMKRRFGATCWMHGVFAAQLTIGNTSFHKLFRSRATLTTSRARAVCAC